MNGAVFSRPHSRREVERLLAEHSLLAGPRRVGPLHDEDLTFGARLCEALLALGPYGIVLGRYLASRLDVLSVRDAGELLALPDRAPAMPGEAVRELLVAELGPFHQVFAAFEESPRTCRRLHQTHRAVLVNGLRVLVKVSRPGWEEGLEEELRALRVLRRVFAGRSGVPFDEVLDDFRRDLVARLDRRREAESLETLARDLAAPELVLVPRVESARGTSRVLVVEDPGGRTLEEIAAPPGPLLADAEDLARRVGLVWLRIVVTAGLVPVEADLAELADGRLAVVGGRFVALPAASQVNLWDYLRAVARHEGDQAAACLQRELRPGGAAVLPGELRSRVRQVVPFRDGAWSETGEGLAEFAVLHWGLLRPYGYFARAHLVAFYRGLYKTARTLEPFAGTGDPLRDALTDLEWSAGWNQLRQLAKPDQAAAVMETYLAGLLELPAKLDRFLRTASDPETGFVVRTGGSERHRAGRAAGAVALVLAMVAVALVERQLEAALGAVWGERLAVVLFVVFGALFLRLALKKL